MNEPQSGADRADRHLQIEEAIRGLDNVIDQLDSLCNRINGTDEPPICPADKVSSAPSLNGVLTDSADRIRQKRDDMSVKINGIENLLF
jgi:hypothetical protein